MQFDDLAPYGALAEFSPDSHRVKAIGWLGEANPIPTGPVEPRAIERLFALITQPPYESRATLLGFHACTLCPDAHERTATLVSWRRRGILRLGKRWTAEVGGSELFVPGIDCVYVAPSMIIHYVLTHGYRPPTIFLRALLQTPSDPDAYCRALRANGAAAYIA
jgi:hypothetical protein